MASRAAQMGKTGASPTTLKLRVVGYHRHPAPTEAFLLYRFLWLQSQHADRNSIHDSQAVIGLSSVPVVLASMTQ